MNATTSLSRRSFILTGMTATGGLAVGMTAFVTVPNAR